MIDKIEYFKEVLSVMPKNNIKNNRNYIKKSTEIKNEVLGYKSELVKELEKRFNKINSISVNDNISKLEKVLSEKKNNLYLLNKLNTPYEKSELNKILYDLGKFYKNDLSKVNKDISIAIDKFKIVGVDLKSEDFDYGIYVKEYMTIFFNNYYDNNFDVLKESFDNIYWKCPDIINYIKVNFRKLYFKNIKKFNNYYENRLKDLNIKNESEYLGNYQDDLREYLFIKSSDIKLLEDSFINATMDIKEYSLEKINKLKSSIIGNSENISSDTKAVMMKLSNTLFEYKNSVRFAYVTQYIKNIYIEKNNNKTATKPILKDIAKNEKVISKMNSKIRFKRMFNKNFVSSEKYDTAISNSLIALNNLYKDLDDAIFKEKVANTLNDNSTVLDALKLICSYDINLRKIIKENKEDIENEELEDEIRCLVEFILCPNNNIINNLTIIDEKDIPMIIVDKYKLMGINVDKEMLDENNLDNIISTVDKILVSEYINSSNITVDNISFAVEAKKIIEKNSN